MAHRVPALISGTPRKIILLLRICEQLWDPLRAIACKSPVLGALTMLSSKLMMHRYGAG